LLKLRKRELFGDDFVDLQPARCAVGIMSLEGV